MNEKHYRTYTKEFKLQALELLGTSGKSAAQIERDLGITTGLLLKWRDRYQVKQEGNGAAHLATSAMSEAQAEIRRLLQSHCASRSGGSRFREAHQAAHHPRGSHHAHDRARHPGRA
ncbi:MAG: transposase [Anaerolineae bacterium]|nr:transposase [Anaerolineae bacterium]